jgi:hypothetical protein
VVGIPTSNDNKHYKVQPASGLQTVLLCLTSLSVGLGAQVEAVEGKIEKKLVYAAQIPLGFKVFTACTDTVSQPRAPALTLIWKFCRHFLNTY